MEAHLGMLHLPKSHIGVGHASQRHHLQRAAGPLGGQGVVQEGNNILPALIIRPHLPRNARHQRQRPGQAQAAFLIIGLEKRLRRLAITGGQPGNALIAPRLGKRDHPNRRRDK